MLKLIKLVTTSLFFHPAAIFSLGRHFFNPVL